MSKRELVISDLTLTLEKRKTNKNLSVKVIPPTGSIKVTAPTYINDETIKEFILKNLTQIKNAVEKVRGKYAHSIKNYTTGEKHYLWGNEYTLLISNLQSNKVYKLENRLVIQTNKLNPTIEEKEKLLNEFYRQELKLVLPNILNKYAKIMNLQVNQYNVKNMKTRWGTCNINKKRIWINLQLAKRPRQCLEYVVVHELTHLLERDHNERFYSIVQRYYPAWRKAESILKTII